jgi:hypothetical protein
MDYQQEWRLLMARPKRNEFEKKTLNFRPGDFDKMGELFPAKGPSVAIRETIAAFVDKLYTSAPTPIVPASIKGLTDE